MVDAVLMREGNIGLGAEKVTASRTFWTHFAESRGNALDLLPS